MYKIYSSNVFYLFTQGLFLLYDQLASLLIQGLFLFYKYKIHHDSLINKINFLHVEMPFICFSF